MPKITTIYWRDIPAQVTSKSGRKRAKILLSPRFQEAIDRAAMRAKKVDADAYLDDWRRDVQVKEGEMEDLVADTASAYESDYTEELLETIVRNKGFDPNSQDPS